MSFLLWYGEGDDDAVSLGSTLEVLPAFAEVARVLGEDPDYDELQSVPGFAEQEVTPWWLTRARGQARRLLREKGDALSDRARRVLARLASAEFPAPDEPPENPQV